MENHSPDRWQQVRILAAFVGILFVVGVWYWLGSGDSRTTTAEKTSPLMPEVSPLTSENELGPNPQIPKSPTEAVAAVPAQPPTSETSAVTRDEELKAQFVGIWYHAENGDQWIENRADGTSRMLLKLDFVASLLYGKQTTMELKWDVRDGVLSHTVVSGSPQKNVDSLVKEFGQAREYVILEMTPERMLLETKDKKKKKDLWTRTPAPPEWAVQKTESPDSASNP